MHTAKTFAAPAALAAALCAATTAMASMDTWQENAATPFVTINVASDMTLSDALTAGGVTLTGAAALVKTGGGTVTVDDASGIGSFAGQIHVFQGGWSVGTASGFGTTGTEAEATWVYPSGCVLVTDVTVSHTGEIFHLAGTGKSDWNGWGAIRFPTSTQGSAVMAAGAYGSRWILEEDATILLSDDGGNSSFLTTIDLELNGHELTLWRGKYGNIQPGWGKKNRYGYFKSVTGAGGIVLKNDVAFSTFDGFNAPQNWTYTDGNYICLQHSHMGFQQKTSKAGFRLVTRALAESDWNVPAAAAGLKPQIYLMKKSASDETSKSFNAWSGPVTLGCDLNIRQENQDFAGSMTFTNKVSGAGGLAVTSGKTWLYLDCPENDFEGGVTLCGPDNRLVLANDGALPADGGRLLMTNSTVAFPATVSADWSLPALELAGTSVVQNSKGRWTGVTALPGADASYESVLGADALTLKQNAKLAIRSHFSRAAYSGWEEHYDLDYSLTDYNSITQTISTQSSPRYAEGQGFRNLEDSSLQKGTKSRSFVYKAFLWNNSPTNETWTFAGHFAAPLKIWLNGVRILNKEEHWQPYRSVGTLLPGANSIVVHSYDCNWQATSGGQNLGLWAGVENMGFAYAVGDVPKDDPNNFSRFSANAPGDGSLCTTMSGDETLDGVKWRPDFAVLAMEAGSVLDLDNDGLAVGTATGSGTVTNGSLTVSQALVVSPSVFEDGGIAVDGNLILGAGAKISFPNSDSLRKRDAGSFTLATASGTISGFTGASMLEIDGSHRCWKANLSADGKTLSLELAPEATVLTFR